LETYSPVAFETRVPKSPNSKKLSERIAEPSAHGAAPLFRKTRRDLHTPDWAASFNQKRIPAIDNDDIRRWNELRSEAYPNDRATLIRKIKNIFEVKFSGETHHQITANCLARSTESHVSADIAPCGGWWSRKKGVHPPCPYDNPIPESSWRSSISKPAESRGQRQRAHQKDSGKLTNCHLPFRQTRVCWVSSDPVFLIICSIRSGWGFSSKGPLALGKLPEQTLF
jgi:hypothetical protein